MKNTRLKKGFTLIELMVVIVILTLLATFFGPKIMNRAEDARVLKVKNDIKAMDSALKMYKLDTGSYPTTEQGLSALLVIPEIEPIPKGWKPGGYLGVEEVPLDPWQNDYIYRSPTDVEGRDFEIISFGADKKEGGVDYDADITSYNIK